MAAVWFALLWLCCMCAGHDLSQCDLSQSTISCVDHLLSQQLESLRKEHEAQKMLVAALQTQLRAQAAVLETLHNNTKVKHVAFSASLVTTSEGFVGPSITHTHLVFKRIFTNVGDAYSSITGYFTAPLRGVYLFHWHVAAYGAASFTTGARLLKNGQNLFLAYERDVGGAHASASNSASLLLEAGDVVSLSAYPQALVFDNGNFLTTFSGFLLFSM